MERVGGAAAGHERASATASGCVRQRVAGVGGNLRRSGPSARRLHDAADAREAVLAEEARRRAVRRDHEVLDQLGASGSWSPPPARPPRRPRTTGRASTVWMSSAPRWWRRRAQALGDAGPAGGSARPAPALAAIGGGHRRRRLEPRRDAVGRPASRGCARARDRRPSALTSPSASTVISTTMASRSCPSASEVRSVESRSGSIGKMIGRGVDRDACWPAACRSIGRAVRDQRIDVGDGDEDRVRAVVASGSRHASADRDRASRRRRSRPRAGRADRGSTDRGSSAGQGSRPASRMTSAASPDRGRARAWPAGRSRRGR